ncbi:MAG: DnaD domain protein [Bacilli bacterium]|nr:DnaD domain protein [Bacilli bacterium]
MNKLSILPADTYTVINKTIITTVDCKVLFMLYQPIIGHLPITLYLTLLSDLDKTDMMSIEYNHHHLMTVMQLKLTDIIDAREKLEAIGLIKTYYKKGDINNYVYQLYSPLGAAEFLTHPLLNILLFNYVGKKEYDKLVNYYKLPKIDTSDFEDITIHFNELFDTTPSNNQGLLNDNLKKKTTNNVDIKLNIDFDYINASIPKGLLNDKAFDNSVKELVKTLSYLYKIDTLHMANIIKGCINEKGHIDKLKLRTSCRNYYQFENDNKLPGLIYRNQPELLRAKNNDESKRSKVIYTFETLSPYDFLRAKYNGGTPTSRDTKLVESLLVDQALNPGVVNVLIDYITKINNNKLSKNFVETIAGQWKRINIKTVEEAMLQAEKEHKKYQKNIATPTSNYKKGTTEKVPDWFNKEIESKQLSTEKETKLKNILEKYS